MLRDKEGISCVLGKLELSSCPVFCPQFTCVLGQGWVVLSLSHHWTQLPGVLMRCAQMC